MATLRCDRCGAKMGVLGDGLLPASFRCPPCAHPAWRGAVAVRLRIA